MLSISEFVRSNGRNFLKIRADRYQFVDTKAHSSILEKVKFSMKEVFARAAVRFTCALKNGCPKVDEKASHWCDPKHASAMIIWYGSRNKSINQEPDVKFIDGLIRASISQGVSTPI